jgi:circadian clock protein KaiC
MRSVGIDLAPWAQAGLLQYHGTRPTAHGLELHLVKMHKLIEAFQPSVVVLDVCFVNSVPVGFSHINL